MNRLNFRSFFPLILILIVYFALRIQNILSLPVFCDEAIYLRWSQIIRSVETLRFIPLTDGKQPLFMWLTAAILKFITDPLLAGRLISVFAGAGLVSAIYLFCFLFINSTTAIIAASLYLLLPFSFFFDRLALADTLLSFFGIISLTLSLLLAKFPRLDIALLLGFSLGLAWLTKSPAIYFLILSLLSFAVYRPSNLKKIYFPLISLSLAFVIYNILRLGPQFHQIALRNLDYVWPISEIMRHPLDPLLPHLMDILVIYRQYVSWPVIFLALLGLIYLPKNKTHLNLPIILLCWWLLPLLGNAAIAKVFTARYVLFTLPPLIVLLAWGATPIFKFRPLNLLLIIACFLPNLIFLKNLSLSPATTILPPSETGYTTSWTSGWGIGPASDYLINRSQFVNVIVGTEGFFGTLPDGLQIYTNNIPRLTVFGVGIDIHQVPEKLQDARNHGDEVYLLFNRSRLKLTPDESAKLTLIKTYSKPGLDQLLLYQLK